MILEARSYNTWKTRNCEKIPWFTKKNYTAVVLKISKNPRVQIFHTQCRTFARGDFLIPLTQGEYNFFFESLHGLNMVLKMAFLYNRNLGFRDFGIFGLGFGLPTSFTIL